jgi:D-alanyl-lipoteichoic acid acyltransferase DltB (MBOAT superfamily)
MKVRNTFIIFLVSGFWHGANWTFIVWGGLNALYFLPLLLLKRNRTNLGVIAEGRRLPSIRESLQMGTTFMMAVIAWIFFRAENIHMALDYFGDLFSPSLFSVPFFHGISMAKWTVGMTLVFLLVEWYNREMTHGLKVLPQKGLLRYTIYCCLLLAILFNSGSEQQFIYFQF